MSTIVFVEFTNDMDAFEFIKHVQEAEEILVGYGRGEIENGYAVPARIATVEVTHGSYSHFVVP